MTTAQTSSLPLTGLRVVDFTRVLALPIDADTRTAAQARLDQLGAKTQIVQTRRPRVLIKYASESDRDVVANVRNDLLRSNLYDVSDIELQSGRRTVGDVRYVAGDEKAAADISATVEMALAKAKVELADHHQRRIGAGQRDAARGGVHVGVTTHGHPVAAAARQLFRVELCWGAHRIERRFPIG